ATPLTAREPTSVYRPGGSPAERPPARCAVALVAGTDHAFSAEVGAILRRRLRIAALIFLLPFVFFLFRKAFNLDDPPSPGCFDLTFHIVVTAVIAAATLLVWRPRELTMCRLRRFE